ncbi:MAG: PadR family transcriptional regulator [Candidatus Krumholzibacteriia bacterium]
MTLNRELTAASTIPLVLSILDRRECYGYLLIKEVRDLSGDRIAWSDGMLYPVLRRLESQSLIVSRWSTAETGRKRRYYALTPDGREELRRQKEQWKLVGDVLHRLWKEDASCST